MKYRKIMNYAGMWVIKLFPTDVNDNNLAGYEVDVEDALNKKRKVNTHKKRGETK